MQFVLVIKLDNAEVEEAGIEVALPSYLSQVAERCATGSADAGLVRDGNGNTIGQYRTLGDGEPGEINFNAIWRHVTLTETDR